MIDQFINRSIDQLIGWSIDRLIDWSIDRSINWSMDRLIDWSIERLIDWSIVRLINWSIDQLTDWSIDRLIGWSIDRLIASSIVTTTPLPPVGNRSDNSARRAVTRRGFVPRIEDALAIWSDFRAPGRGFICWFGSNFKLWWQLGAPSCHCDPPRGGEVVETTFRDVHRQTRGRSR